MPSRRKKSVLTVSNAVAIVVVLAVFVVGFSFGTTYTKSQHKPEFLLVQQAVGGTFIQTDAATNTYQLRIVGVKPHTLLFTDRPNRIVGSWTMNDFVTRWTKGQNSFESDPPNAVLLSHDLADGKEYAIVVELKNPVYNSFAGSLTYTARVVSETKPGSLVPSSDRHMEEFPQTLHSPALFIDNIGGGSYWGI